MVKYLVEEVKADVFKRNGYGRNCLHMSIISGNFETFKYLISRYPSFINTRDFDNNTILTFAAQYSAFTN